MFISLKFLFVASKLGCGPSVSLGDPDVRIGLDHLRFGMDRGYGSVCGFFLDHLTQP